MSTHNICFHGEMRNKKNIYDSYLKLDIKGYKPVNVLQYPKRDNIHQYQCNNPFII